MDSFELSKIAGAVICALLLIVTSKLIIEARLAPHGEEQVGYRLPMETAEAPAADAAAPEAGVAAPEAGVAAPAATDSAAAEAPAAPAADAAAPANAPAPAAGGFDPKAVVAMLASAKPEDGAGVFKKCSSCHVVKKDAPSTVAPNLWGIVGRPKGGYADFAAKYSDALKGKGGDWTYEDLAAFIHKPKGYLPGTKMVFNGIKDNGDIANLIAYMRTLADQPAPLPN